MTIRFALTILWACGSLLAQQDLVISGSHASGTAPCQAGNTITSDTANPFTVSGSASVKCEAGGTIHLQTGFHATAGTGAPTFDAFVTSQAVAPVWVSPGDGTGGPTLTERMFKIDFNDNLGAADISGFQVSFGDMGAAAGICSLVYSGGVLGLWDNAASQLKQTPPLQNNQCVIGNYSVTPSGNTLTFTVAINFLTSFQGGKELYALAVSSSGDYHPWVDLGLWTVLPPGTAPPQIFDSAGTSAWTAPIGVTTVKVEAWGPGGAGARSTLNSGWYLSGGAGGGGAYASKIAVPVTPGQTYSVVVGGGGSATKSSFGGTTVVADAGQSGLQATIYPSGGAGGAAGLAANSVGDVTQSGVAGTGGGNTYGGNGGAGGNGGVGEPGGGWWTNGYAGTSPGGGGGGAGASSSFAGSTGNSGGAGGNGKVVITYAGPPVTTFSISGRVTLSGAGLGGVSIAVSGTQTGSTSSDANGNYTISNLTAGGTYTVSASKSGYVLSSGQTFSNLSANQVANFTATGGVTQYQLTTTVSPAVGGTISPACPGGCAYTSGTQITVLATAGAGYQFAGFTGSVSSGSNPLTVTLTNSMTVTATFTPIVPQYQLITNVSPVGAGTVTLSPPGAQYSNGTQVGVTATANVGFQFSGFSGSLTGGSPGYVTMNSSKSVTANFISVPAMINLTISRAVSPGVAAHYSLQIANAGSSPLTFAVSSGLPPGATVNFGPSPAGGNGFVDMAVTATNYGNTEMTVTATSPLADLSTKATLAVEADSLIALQQCLDNAANAMCTLAASSISSAPATYTVYDTINIKRYGVTLEGGNSNRKLTRLVRGSTFTGPLVRVAVNDPNTGKALSMPHPENGQPGVLIRNLTFCGGGNTTPNVKLSQPNPPPNAYPAVSSPSEVFDLKPTRSGIPQVH